VGRDVCEVGFPAALVVAALVLQILAQAKAPAAPGKEIAVLVSRRIGVGDVRAENLAHKVSEYLRAQGFDRVTDPSQAAKQLAVMGVEDSAKCDGKRECVTGLGRVLRAWGVVALDVADLDGTMAIHFEALQSDDGEKLAVLDVVLPSKKVEVELVEQLAPFSAALRTALDAAGYEVKPLPDDAPVATQLKPAETTPVVETGPPMSKARVGALVTTASTVVAGALVILFVAQAGGAQRQLDGARVDRPNGAVGYNLPETQARDLGAKVNDNYSAALGVGIGAAALAVVSAVLWAQP
jgi:hypothetical protein